MLAQEPQQNIFYDCNLVILHPLVCAFENPATIAPQTFSSTTNDCTALLKCGLKVQLSVKKVLAALWQQTAEKSSDGADWCVIST